MAAFEDRLIDAVERDEHSILVRALTCNAEKEFIFQSTNASEFLKRLTNMPQEEERYPIRIERYDDPDWNYFKAVVSQVDSGNVCVAKSTYIIDGKNFSTLTEFFDEFQSRVQLEEGFGNNLDAFNDVIRGGFGTPDEYVLVWKNSELSRERLGYPETATELERRLQCAHPSAHSSIEKRIRMAKAQTGETVFD